MHHTINEVKKMEENYRRGEEMGNSIRGRRRKRKMRCDDKLKSKGEKP